MAHVLKSELVIEGSDKTGGMWASVIRRAERLKETLAGMNGMGVDPAGVRRASREIREQTRLLEIEQRAVRGIANAQREANDALAARGGMLARLQSRFPHLAHMSGMGWMVGGLASGRLAHATAHDAAEFAHQRAMLSVAGMTPADVREAVDKSLSMRIAGMSAADNLRAIGELRMVFGSTEHALQHVAAVQKAAAALKAINPNMDAEGEAYNLARSLELKGISNDAAHFLRLENMMVKAINASRGKVTAADFMAFTSRAGTGTTGTLSDYFYSRIAPTLIQEMHGDTAGRALATLRRALLGGHMQTNSAQEWLDLGLLHRQNVIFDKIGHVKRVKPGALVNSDLFSTDPYAWIQGYLLPALRKKYKNVKGGLTDTRIATEMATLFSDRYAENMATILLKQRQRIEKDARIAGGGQGLEAADYARTHDPLAAARDVGAAANTFLSALGGPLASPAIGTMNFVSNWMRYLAQDFGHFSARHPYQSMGVTGALGAGALYLGVRGIQSTFGILGLGRSATALSGSAAALDGAATALDGAAAKLGLTPSGPVSSVAKNGVVPWLASRAGYLLGLPVAAAGLYFGSTETANAGERDIYKRNADGSITLTPYGRSLNPGVAGVPMPPPRSDIEHAKPPAKAEITGNADVKVHVDVKTEPGFWSRINSAVTNGINHLRVNGPAAGSTGSLGSSMPETGVPVP